VARELYVAFEPLALARLLLAPGDLDRLVRRSAAVSPAAGEAWDVRALVRDVLEKKGVRPSPPPPRRDASAVAFCPSCLAEYRAGFSVCSDCETPLRPYGR